MQYNVLQKFELRHNSKKPLHKGFIHFRGEIPENSPYGVLLKTESYSLLVVDIDTKNGGDLCDFQMVFDYPATLMRRTPSGGYHLYFRLSHPQKLQTRIPQFGEGIDFLTSFCTWQTSANNYFTEIDLQIADCPIELLNALKPVDKSLADNNQRDSDVTLDELLIYLNYYPIPVWDNRETWIKIGMAICNITKKSQDGLDLWERESKKSSKYDVQILIQQWNSFTVGASSYGAKFLIHLAIEYGYSPYGDMANTAVSDFPKRKKQTILEELKEWVFVHKYQEFFNLIDFRRYKLDTMCNYVINITGKGSAKKFLLATCPVIGEAQSYVYVPQSNVKIDDIDGAYINLWRDSLIHPVDGDASVFINHIRWMFDTDAEDLIGWMAYLLQKIERPKWAPILIGRPGVGKSLIMMALERLVGEHNCSRPSNDVIAGQFTSWATFKRLILIEELKQGNNADVYNKLKTRITDDRVEAHLKGKDSEFIHATAAFMASSNYDKPLNFEFDDRRFAIFKCYRVRNLANIDELAYFQNLYNFTISNLGVIKHMLLNWDLTNFNPNVCPVSDAKKQLLTDSNNTGLQLHISRLFSGNPKVGLFTIEDVRPLLDGDMAIVTDANLHYALKLFSGVVCRYSTYEMGIERKIKLYAVFLLDGNLFFSKIVQRPVNELRKLYDEQKEQNLLQLPVDNI